VAAVATPQRQHLIDGRYVVEGELGQGGMARVYRVRDQATGKVVALKQMEHGDDEGGLRLRFQHEFHTMASLRHPRIVEVFDYGIDHDRPYYTLELLDGQDLHDLDMVTPRRACELLRDVASALAFLHARRLIHRDLGTRNIRCTSDGRAKLIDFGVLATAGVAGDVAGTPPYVAPETSRGQPIDQRVDLFGLGALAYRILGGRHAFPARTLDQLEPLWQQRIPPPSKLAPDISTALDELVMSLLAIDPMARPANAAEVIDRLTAIGGLEPLPDAEVAHGWIASSALVGRQREMTHIRRAVARASNGRGRSIVIEAPSGTGKTRLLRELALEAQLAGMVVIRAHGDAAGRGPYGVVNAIASELLATCPEEAVDTAHPRAAMLARVIPGLRARLRVTAATPAGDPAEDRMRLQAELAAWILDIARRRSILIAVDDIQRCDESSAAVLAAVSHDAADRSLLVGVALRSDEPVRAAAAIASIVDAGQRLRLRGLDEAQLGELCRSLFGAVPHITRLAHWMHKSAGGTPFHSLELARHLVDIGVIRYADGLWVIPDELARDELPRGLAEAMDARIALLPASVCALGEVLALHGGALALADIVELAEDDHAAVFEALDRLAYEEVLIQAGDRWQFRHDGLREAFLRHPDEERRKQLHLRVGEILERRGALTDRDAEIGWHLLRGGQVARGATLLGRAGRALYDAQAFSDCIAPLEAALGAMRSRATKARLELLHMLLMAGCMADRDTALRHVDACVDAYRRASGVHVATRVRRVIGKHLGVAVGLLWATFAWVFGLCRGLNPFAAFRSYFIVVGYASTIHGLAFDLPEVEKLIELLEPVAILENRIPYAVYLLTRNLYEFPHGNLELARRNCERILQILATDRLTPIREIDRRTGGGGARYILTLLSIIQLEDSKPHLAELDALGLRFFAIGADQARIIEHRMRGEEAAAAELENRVDLAFVQLGSVWQVESFMPAICSIAFGFSRDMLGLRRMIERLTAVCAAGFRHEPFLALARGEYLRERGDFEAARRELESVETSPQPMFRLHALPALAETLLALGEHERAREVAERGYQDARDPRWRTPAPMIRCQRVWALADTAAGRHAIAATRLEEAIRDAEPTGNPLLCGSLHEARARVAFVAGDFVTYRLHLTITEKLFRSTDNPVLIARANRLAAASEMADSVPDRLPTSPSGYATEIDRAGRTVSSPRRQRELERSLISIDAVTTPPPGDPRRLVSAVLSKCRGDAERAARALQLLVEDSQAIAGYLYLRRGDALELVAPTFGDEPPTALRQDLDRVVASCRAGEEATIAGSTRWRSVVLAFELDDQTVVVGAAALVSGAVPIHNPDAGIVASIARELFEAGDVTHTRL